MKRQTKKNIKNKMMPMLPKQKKRTPAGMILGLTYLDMMHHIQPRHDARIIERQREILKPFIKTDKNKNKTTKIKKRGGHVFYYNVLPEICGLGVHEYDCVPSTLHFLGLLTYEAAAYLAQETGNGLDYRSILVWLDENFPDESQHVANSIFDLREYFLRRSKRGRRIYDMAAINEENDTFMHKLNYLLPYNQMGVMAGYVTYSEENREFSEGGHVFCIIKDENGQLVLIDPQGEEYIEIHSIRDVMRYLENEGAHELILYIQEDVSEELTENSPEQLRGPNNYIVPDPNAFNADHMLTINRAHKEEYENGNNENGNNNENNENGNNAPYENAKWDYWNERWYNSTGYYNANGTYHYNLG
jgi:hypothetical protein